MKRIIGLLICVVILLCACDNSKTGVHEGREDTVGFKTGSYFLKFWNMAEYNNYEYDAIPNEDIAIKVAREVFAGIPKSNQKQKYTAQEVFFDEEDEVWIITFTEDLPSTGPISTGNCCSIALQKKDGKVLSIWFGE